MRLKAKERNPAKDLKLELVITNLNTLVLVLVFFFFLTSFNNYLLNIYFAPALEWLFGLTEYVPSKERSLMGDTRRQLQTG